MIKLMLSKKSFQLRTDFGYCLRFPLFYFLEEKYQYCFVFQGKEMGKNRCLPLASLSIV